MIKPAKKIPNKWENTIVQESPIKGISLSIISRYDLIFRYLGEEND